MSKKRALGRGLSALLNEQQTEREPADSPSSNELFEIPVEQLETNPYQPRTQFKEADLEELAQSIRALGLIQPITVRKLAAKRFQLVSGERRFRACQRAGLESVTAYVRMANDREMLEMALVENIQRRDLNAIEIALSYERLAEELKLTQEAISARVGKKRSTITNYLRLLRLDPIIQSGIRDEMISMGHGRALINIADKDLQLDLYERIIRHKLSVRQTEQLLRRTNPAQPKTEKADELPNHLKKAQKEMGDFLHSPVNIQCDKRGKGKISINFESREDFERLYQKLHA